MTTRGSRILREARMVTVVDGLVPNAAGRRFRAALVAALVEAHPEAAIVVVGEHAEAEPAAGVTEVLVQPKDGSAADPAGLTEAASPYLAEADVVWALGFDVAVPVAKTMTSHARFFPLVVRDVLRDPRFLPGDRKLLEFVGSRATVAWFTSESARSTAEGIANLLCERTGVIGTGADGPPARGAGPETLVQPLEYLTTTSARLLEGALVPLVERPETYETSVVGEPRSVEQTGAVEGLRFVPGLRLAAAVPAGQGGHFCVVDDLATGGADLDAAVADAWHRGLHAVPVSALDEDLLQAAARGEVRASSLAVTELPSRYRAINEVVRALTDAPVPLAQPVRVVLAGADLKFAGALVQAFDEDPRVEFLMDKYDTNGQATDAQSRPLAAWADVVVCEFMAAQAVWYSHHLPPGKQLVVHLHGFELFSTWADKIDMDRVDRVVVVSAFYRDTAVAHRGWPAEKFEVIPNGASRRDLDRQKDEGARFQLAMVGWVPSLKRLDRALDVIEALVAHDDRYHLSIRGAAVWNYGWEWGKPSHRDGYLRVLERLRTSPGLAAHVSFAPFGADVGNWLRSIGWVLSPSVRETFHLAPVEGMVSGAVPLVWEREGAGEVFPAEWVLPGTADIVERVLEVNADPSGWQQASEDAQAWAAARYDFPNVTRRWAELVVELGAQQHAGALPAFVEQSLEAAVAGDLVESLDILDAHVPQTSGATGFVKQHELWVRGMHALRLRLAELGPRLPAGVTTASGPRRPLVVQAADPRLPVPALRPGAAGTVLVPPPPGSPGSRAFDPELFRAFGPMVPLVGDVHGLPVRLDRFVDLVAADLARLVEASDARDIVVEGSLWTVVPALLAARVTGGAVWWDLRYAPPGAASAWREAPDAITDDPWEAISWFVAGRVAGVLMPDRDLNGDEQAITAELERRRSGSLSMRPARRLLVAAWAAPELRAALATRPGVELHEVPLERLGELDGRYDAFVLDLDSAPLLDEASLRALSALRAKGIVSCVLTPVQPVTADGLRAVAAADVVVARRERDLPAYAARHPLAARALASVDACAADETARRIVLQLGASEDAAERSEPEAATPVLPMTAGRTEAADAMPEPVVSVVVAASRVDGSLERCLRSLAVQRLRAGVAEVIVVLNGPAVSREREVLGALEAMPGPAWRVLLSRTGAGAARNVGLAAARAPHVTFVDDDDELEQNALAALLAVAGPDEVAVTDLVDVGEDGVLARDTHGRRGALRLGLDRPPAAWRPGLFQSLGGRLLPTARLRELRFDEALGSGEDVAFLSAVAVQPGLRVVAAHPLPERAYRRRVSAGSVSRPARDDLRFGVGDRLGVLSWIAAATERLEHPAMARAWVDALAAPQARMMRTYLDRHPEDEEAARHLLAAAPHAVRELAERLGAVRGETTTPGHDHATTTTR